MEIKCYKNDTFNEHNTNIILLKLETNTARTFILSTGFFLFLLENVFKSIHVSSKVLGFAKTQSSYHKHNYPVWYNSVRFLADTMFSFTINALHIYYFYRIKGMWLLCYLFSFDIIKMILLKLKHGNGLPISINNSKMWCST